MNKKLEELCDIVRGSSPRPQGDVRYYGGSIPRLMVSDLTRDGMFVMPTTDSLTEAGAKLSRPMSKGDLVIAVSGNPGLPAILKTDACIHDGFVGLRNLSKIVYTEYLYYYLFYNKNINHALAVGAIFKNLTTDQIKNLTIPLPDFDTQQKIAQILSEADKARQLRRSANALTDQFLQSTFLSMFGDPVSNPKGWPVKNLGNVLTNIRYGTGSPPIYSETGIPFIRATNIKKGRIEEKGMVYISNEEADKISKCQITQGDLIIVRSGVNTGDAAVISEQYSGCYAGYDLIIEMPIVSSIFYNQLINSEYGKIIIDPLTRRAGQPHLNAEQIKSLSFYCPPVELQQQFADIVTQTEELRLRQRAHEVELEQLFKGLLQRYFG